jgi:hypothetical protein
MNNKFLAMWDCNGLECLFDITDLEHDAMISGLKNEKFKTPFNISMLMMRARLNSQRSYEIYSFETESDIDYECIKDMFEHTPQTIVNAIRKNGNKIYSDYTAKERVIS